MYCTSCSTKVTWPARTSTSSAAICAPRLFALPALLPSEAEAVGLLALMLLHDSRREARVSDEGDLVLLENQDRSKWNRPQIEEGIRLIERALRMGRPGPYQIQGAIAAVHAEA